MPSLLGFEPAGAKPEPPDVAQQLMREFERLQHTDPAKAWEMYWQAHLVWVGWQQETDLELRTRYGINDQETCNLFS